VSQIAAFIDASPPFSYLSAGYPAV
jgi:hypothetical protein